MSQISLTCPRDCIGILIVIRIKYQLSYLYTFVIYCTVPGVVEFDVSRSSLSNEMLITWNEPAQPNGVILAYQVIYSIYNNGTTSVSNILSNSTREYVITHLSKCISKIVMTTMNCIRNKILHMYLGKSTITM